jgi:hypothetical protein
MNHREDRIGEKFLVVCFLLSAFAAMAVAAAKSAGPPKNLIELHKSLAKMTNAQCLACHSGIKTGVSLNAKIKTFHRLHLESKRETPKSCSDCHESVDLRNASGAELRKQVDPQVCAVCHSGGQEGIKTLFGE